MDSSGHFSGRISHFQIGAYSHQHVLHLADAQAIGGIHAANHLIAIKKSGKTDSAHVDKLMSASKDMHKASDELRKNTRPTGPVLFDVPRVLRPQAGKIRQN